uniref:Mitochondrial inner membrane protease subunit 2 n=1 Tax=Pseudo-nitzschia arenysensis TaxID=697910 RepID=A0A6T9YI78_9STRA|mmetsp:Transcript_652/g.1549  ORF Transcript_652/g.1549 Transcript_652/m.1549 type:complete len:231 (+) Transcript_652:119-811(+)|eukprot:CAMPEP_0116136458 /NCGR_PEP_ID=MMETSP0329-20121206/11734_1 /TAXON_ID=697910 /ORGANISM="Pseudo-nitzschia arenysensis, Strain B593" /LENGTH=230 /DNA_ID=CAMNT_0003631325 /DNA_START=53 /DNA_END=745 /DNA_ORIENTATION=-
MAFSQQLLKGRAAPSFLASCGTLVAVTPLIVWAHDSLFSLCRVRDSSMEPTLFPGDILVVRKADGFWQRWTTTKEEAIDETASVERERILAYERDHCNSNGAIGLLRKPPIPISGNIIVFKNPEKYPDQWSIQRVLATGGETVRPKSSNKRNFGEGESSAKKDTRIESTVYIPPYSIYVQGDNCSASSTENYNKGGHGPVSKKLLVGIAEFRVWPPWRMGKVAKEISEST